MITRENAIKTLITENFLDKEHNISGVFPEIKEAVIASICSLRCWEILSNELESRIGNNNVFQTEEWNEGFNYAIELIYNHVKDYYIFQIEHSVREKQ